MTCLRVLFVDSSDHLSEVETRYRPLWPGYLAAYAKTRFGPDSFRFRVAGPDLQRELVSFSPRLVAISSVTQNYNSAIANAALARRHGAAVVIGGMHISSLPETLSSEMDVACIGEGEATFSDLLELIRATGSFQGDHLGNIPGVAFRRAGQLVTTPARRLFDSLDDLPPPDRSLVGYPAHSYMFTTRGCPYRCSFCASSRFWDRVRYASAERIASEIADLSAHGVRRISFYDDLFVFDKRRLRSIADLVRHAALHQHVSFTCSCRANHITPEIAELLRSMNFVSVGMGLESGCQRTLDYLKGRVSVSQNWRAIEILKSNGIQANASFVIGAPDETLADMMTTYDFIKSSRLDFFDIYVLTPLPGTPVWQHALCRRLVSSDMDWSRLNVNFEVNARRAVVLSNTLSRRDLIKVYRKFRRLRLVRVALALPFSPWAEDLPRALLRVSTAKLHHLWSRFVAGRRSRSRYPYSPPARSSRQ